MNVDINETIIYKRGRYTITATLTGVRIYEAGRHVLTMPYEEIKKISIFCQQNIPNKKSFNLEELIKVYTSQTNSRDRKT